MLSTEVGDKGVRMLHMAVSHASYIYPGKQLVWTYFSSQGLRQGVCITGICAHKGVAEIHISTLFDMFLC